MRFRARHPWDPSLAGWAGVGGPHLLWGGMGGALPGLQLLAPRTDKASTATAGPEAWEPGEPRAQAAPTGDRLQRLQMLGEVRRKRRGGLKAPPDHPPHTSLPSLPDPMWPRQPSYSPFGAASCVTTPQLFPDALCSGQGTLACLGSPPLAPRTECNGGCCCSNWAMPIAQQVCEGPRRKRLQGG